MEIKPAEHGQCDNDHCYRIKDYKCVKAAVDWLILLSRLSGHGIWLKWVCAQCNGRQSVSHQIDEEYLGCSKRQWQAENNCEKDDKDFSDVSRNQKCKILPYVVISSTAFFNSVNDRGKIIVCKYH